MRALLRQGWAWNNNHVCRTMHILDVISAVSRSSKCTKIADGLGSPDPIAGFKWPHSKAREGKEGKKSQEKGGGAKMIYARGCQKPTRRHCSIHQVIKY